jgi:hypothetical protein
MSEECAILFAVLSCRDRNLIAGQPCCQWMNSLPLWKCWVVGRFSRSTLEKARSDMDRQTFLVRTRLLGN